MFINLNYVGRNIVAPTLINEGSLLSSEEYSNTALLTRGTKKHITNYLSISNGQVRLNRFTSTKRVTFLKVLITFLWVLNLYIILFINSNNCSDDHIKWRVFLKKKNPWNLFLYFLGKHMINNLTLVFVFCLTFVMF